MRCLFLSNFYPPVGSGGYEQWCQEVAEGLLQRGHTVRILTSRGRRGEIRQTEPGWILRELHLEMKFTSLVHSLQFFTSRKQRERENLASLRRQIQEFQPDIVFIWGMWNLPRSLPALAETMLPHRTVYFLADYWPTLPSQHSFYWNAPAKSWATRLPKGALRPLAQRILQAEERPHLRFERVIFPSQFLQDELLRRGLAPKEKRVIYGAVNTRPFIETTPADSQRNGHLSLLYAGRLSPEKGIETAIEAMDHLVHERGCRDIHLSIIGSGESGFVRSLQAKAQAAQLDEYIRFTGPRSKDEMPALYRQFDAFLFTSTWQEPFGRVVVEALASGTVVIGTATGGAGEILVNGENGLVFPAGDPAALAEQILSLRNQPELRDRLVENGRHAAQKKFDLTRMLDEIESYLKSVIGA